MSIRKHTPGTWYVDADLTRDREWRPRIEVYSNIAGRQFIAQLNTFAHVSESCSEGLANAKLISAAPELLEALENLVAWGNIKDGSPDQYLRDAALAAINKAKGIK
jgi:hypothetical protein